MGVEVQPDVEGVLNLVHGACDGDNQPVTRRTGHRKSTGTREVNDLLIVHRSGTEHIRKLVDGEETMVIRTLGIIQPGDEVFELILVAESATPVRGSSVRSFAWGRPEAPDDGPKFQEYVWAER